MLDVRADSSLDARNASEVRKAAPGSTVLHFALIFGATLPSYYFYGLSVSVDHLVVPLVTGLLAISALARGDRGYHHFLLALLFAALISFWLLIPSLSVRPVNFRGYAGFAFALVACGLLLDSLQGGVASFTQLQRVVRATLLVHLTAFALQYLAYGLTGTTLDFLYPITGEEQRTIGGMYTFGEAFRAAGFFNEPGTYCIHIAGLVLMLAALSTVTGRLPRLAVAAAGLSMIVSLSAFGIAAGIVVFAVLAAGSIRSLKGALSALALLVSAGIFMIYIHEILLDYLSTRFFSVALDASLGARLNVIDYVFGRDMIEMMLGDGFVIPDLGEETPISDASVAVDVFRTFGIIGIMGVVCVIYLLMRGSLVLIPLLAVVLASKLAISHPFIWLALVTSIGSCLTAHRIRSSRTPKYR